MNYIFHASNEQQIRLADHENIFTVESTKHTETVVVCQNIASSSNFGSLKFHEI